jgi:hypothetical protein
LIGKNNSETKHEKNKRWQMMLQTNFATKLAVIGEQRRVPSNCNGCGIELVGEVYVCPKDDDFGSCMLCAKERGLTERHKEEEGLDHKPEKSKVYGGE